MAFPRVVPAGVHASFTYLRVLARIRKVRCVARRYPQIRSDPCHFLGVPLAYRVVGKTQLLAVAPFRADIIDDERFAHAI